MPSHEMFHDHFKANQIQVNVKVMGYICTIRCEIGVIGKWILTVYVFKSEMKDLATQALHYYQEKEFSTRSFWRMKGKKQSRLYTNSVLSNHTHSTINMRAWVGYQPLRFKGKGIEGSSLCFILQLFVILDSRDRQAQGVHRIEERAN